MIAAALAAGLLAAISAARPQSGGAASAPPAAQQQQASRGQIIATVTLVVVPVTVKDSSGNLVSDLEQKDFRIFEDGIEQQISVFSVDPVPLSAALLVDDDLKSSVARTVNKTLEAVAGGFAAVDEVSLWRFSTVPEELREYSSDNNDLMNRLKHVELNTTFDVPTAPQMSGEPRVNTEPPIGPMPSQSSTFGRPNTKHIIDAVYAAAETLVKRARDRRKIIVLISDGQNGKNNTHTFDETRRLLLSNDISVYAVGVGSAGLNRGINVMARFAHATGGDIFYAGSREAMENLYRRATEQARNEYTIDYSPAHTDRTALYHSIEVRIERPGLHLLTRDGYYANPH